MIEEKKILNNLEAEKSNLSKNLRLAIEASDGVEITRLKEREKTIDSEIYSAEILAIQAEIKELEAQSVLARQNVVRAEELSKKAGSLVGLQIGVLREEIQTLDNEATAKRVAIKIAERSANETGARLMKLREKLEKITRS
jgi:ABC-type phosphate transport system auxiliary subunit